MFWFVCAAMTLATLGMVLAPILRPPGEVGDNPEVALYKAQLAEVDRDVARHIIAAEDAERSKAEIARRLLAAARVDQDAGQASPFSLPATVIAGVCVATIAGGVYWTIGAPGYGDLPLQTRINAAADMRANRPSQAAAEATAPALAQPDYPADYLASVEQLRRMVPQRGDDLQGWELLAYHEARLRQFPAAAKAQARVIEIKGPNATPGDLLRHADLLVAATDGYVSPEAEERARQVLDSAPNSVGARYYLGALFNQTDRPDLAFRLWRSILDSGAPESAYTELIRQQVVDTAFRAGINYTVPAVAPATSLPGPTSDQMSAASELDAEDRQAMIENMVSGLADRLATEGGTPEEWARLITAYGVLGRTEEAQNILSEARLVFKGSSEALTLFQSVENSLPTRSPL